MYYVKNIINYNKQHLNNKRGQRMKHAIFALFVLTALLVGLTAENVYAAGTPAGTVITNIASLNYKDLSGKSFPVVTATVSITVAQKAGVALTPTPQSQTVGDSVWAYYAYSVQNTGNGKDKFTLSGVSAHGWSTEIYLDANKNGVLDASELAAGTKASSDTLLADSSEYFIVRVFVPKGTTDALTDLLTATATSQFNGSVSASGLFTTTVHRVLVIFTKSQNVTNPQPGQTITYTISYKDSGSSPVLNAVLTDLLNANLTLVGGSITGGGTYNGGTGIITWNFAKINAGGSGSVSFQATVNGGVPSSTVITNQANYSLTDSTNNHTISGSSNTTSASVAFLAGLSSTISPASQTQDVGLPVKYQLTLTNNGNATDSASFSFVTTLSQSWKFYLDINGDGLIDGADSLINPAKVGPMAQGGVLHFIALDTLPQATPDGSKDSLKATFTSLTTPSVKTTSTGVTTVRAPVLTMTKTVAVVGGGQPVPGATLRYTITYSNSGTGAANNVVISDPIPSHTTYVANSVHLNGVQTNDGSGGVVFNSNTVTVTIGTLAANTLNQTITIDMTIN
jgi:uncharacterized repeat protein (TIGR01451 family)